MPARGDLTLFRIRGIRIGVDYSWFLVLFLVIWWLSGFYRSVLGAEEAALGPYVLAVASALAFFGSILLHELGHAAVALRRGIEIPDITLWMFGGVARMGRDSDSAATELRIAVAGPLVTLAIAAICIVAGLAAEGPAEFWRAMRVIEGADTSPFMAVVAWLSTINLIVLVFNLIPAYPLDGGRVARAVAWHLTGKRSRATRFAANLGQGFSYAFIGIGIFLALGRGDVVGGLWLGLIGFILGQSARATILQNELASRIEGLTVADVMDPEPIAIPEDASVERALEEFFLRYRWPWFPVVDPSQRLSGLLERDSADAVPEGSRETRRVGELFERDLGRAPWVRADASLEAMLGNEELRRLGALPAVDAQGRLRGIVTTQQVGRALRTAMEKRGVGHTS